MVRVRNKSKIPIDEFEDEENEKDKSSGKQSTVVPVGLSNLGNTCFFNSVAQCLIQTTSLLDALESEKGERILKVDAESGIDDLEYRLPEYYPLVNALVKFIKSTRVVNSNMKRRIVSPQSLFTQICKTSPRFRGYQQQDSQELLRSLLDDIKMEEIKRKKLGILRSLNLESKKAKDVQPSMRETVKIYGNALKNELTVVDQIFQGQLISSVMCDECGTIAQVTEDFLDLSLPISEDKGQNTHAINAKNKDKCKQNGTSFKKDASPQDKPKNKKLNRKQAKKQARMERRKQRRNKGNMEDESTELNSVQSSNDEGILLPVNKTSTKKQKTVEQNKEVENGNEVIGDLNGENGVPEHDVSEIVIPYEIGICNKFQSLEINGDKGDKKDIFNLNIENDVKTVINKILDEVVEIEMGTGDCLRGGGVLLNPLDDVASQGWSSDDERSTNSEKDDVKNGTGSPDANQSIFDTSEASYFTTMCNKLPQTCSPHYVPKPQECSVESSLHQFTMAEILTGSNKFGCETCTKNRSSVTDNPKEKLVYCNASKMLLIKRLPPVLTIHFKRFHQVGYSLRKINKKVAISETLNMGPYCSTDCLKTVTSSAYKLYGIVEHVGSLSRGHYTAYINMCDNDGILTNNWFHISDSAVSKSTLTKALHCNAYLLFYKRVPL